MFLEIFLYVGDLDEHLNYFTDFLKINNCRYDIDKGYLGYKINIEIDKIDVLSEHICQFMLDFYLKDAVISKVYDEYPCFNTNDASKILTEISDKIINTPIKDHICSIITNKKSFNPESYSLFNLKPIMLCVYALTDNICNKMIYNKEKEQFVSVIKTFSTLSFDKCSRADVEFSKDDNCFVSIDEKEPIKVSTNEILSFLVQKAPENINIKNSSYNPELADIFYEIFNFDKK